MHSITTFFLLGCLALFPFVLSAPAQCSKSIGQPGGVYICPQTDFRKYFSVQCKWRAPSAECYNFPDNRDQEFPVSIGPDAGGVCVFFLGKDCKGNLAQLPQSYTANKL
jgi:hypothetical protein